MRHGADIGEIGDIVQPHRFIRQQTGRHQGQGGILGAADPDLPLEGMSAANTNSIHQKKPLSDPRLIPVIA
jgi:hypothetical protein